MTLNTREDQEQFDTFLDMISPSKKEKVQKKIFETNLLLNTCVQCLISEKQENEVPFEFWMNKAYQ